MRGKLTERLGLKNIILGEASFLHFIAYVNNIIQVIQ